MGKGSLEVLNNCASDWAVGIAPTLSSESSAAHFVSTWLGKSG